MRLYSNNTPNESNQTAILMAVMQDLQEGA